ncbi:XrtA-associated tyrosine autokinase [Thalassotalea atypica]|uniref:XrtA-associated tyrosine autokinase n=1 Tax=Thalassotalea atypica TaxID=2054316 RepID=UPI0025732C31|nr:XrtA-associated tyrosine autokinase [Thalassotalea atypica]
MSTIEKALAKKKARSNQSVDDKPEAPEQEASSILTTEQSKDNIHVNNTVININNDRLTERGFIHTGGDTTHIQEEFRHIKRKLINNAFGPVSKTLKNSNLIMVSSSNPNEGKTFVSINLALSIALEQDKTVLLIDADVLRPSVHRELEFENNKGLLDYLRSDVSDLSEIIYSTSISNLKIMPAGTTHHLTNELLASDRMAKLARELADRYPDRIVIFDCPPLLGVTETPVLASLVGQGIVVVEESKTKLEHVKSATAQLDENLAVGFIINKTIKTSKDVYGYYGYGYGDKR